MATTKLFTVEDVWEMGEDARDELIEGVRHEMAAAGGRHGAVSGQFAGHLWACGEQTGQGLVFAAETGFVIERSPDTLLVPDVAFIKADRLPADGSPIGFVDLIPDVVLEVLSLSQSREQVLAKVRKYLGAGVPLIWVADPESQTVTADTPKSSPRLDRASDELDGGDVLTGFRVPLERFFRSP